MSKSRDYKQTDYTVDSEKYKIFSNRESYAKFKNLQSKPEYVQQISSYEVNRHIEKCPKNIVLFILTLNIRQNGKEIDDSICFAILNGETYKFTVNVGYSYDCGGFYFFNVKHENMNMSVKDMCELINNQYKSITETNKNNSIMCFDPVTNFNILSQRHGCCKIIPNYAKNKTFNLHSQLMGLLTKNVKYELMLTSYLYFSLLSFGNNRFFEECESCDLNLMGLNFNLTSKSLDGLLKDLKVMQNKMVKNITYIIDVLDYAVYFL